MTCIVCRCENYWEHEQDCEPIMGHAGLGTTPGYLPDDPKLIDQRMYLGAVRDHEEKEARHGELPPV